MTTELLRPSLTTDSMDSMKAIGVLAQCCWFAFGLWIGAIFAGAAETVLRDPPPQPTGREILFEWLIVLYIPFSILLSLLFLFWITIRLLLRRGICRVPWLIPLILGIAYFPLLFASIPVLIWLTHEGQGVVIGSSITVVFLGLLALDGEIVIYISKATD